MNESGRGEGVAGAGGELAAGDSAELLIDQRKNLVERVAASGAEIRQQLSDARYGTSWRNGVAKGANRVNSRSHF